MIVHSVACVLLLFQLFFDHNKPTLKIYIPKQGEGAYNQIEAQARRVAQGLGAEYWAVSSKTGDNVEALFLRVAALTFNQAVLQEVQGADHHKHSVGTVSEYNTVDNSSCQ